MLESKIQTNIIKMLRFREWYVKNLHGSQFQSGMPDLFACHAKYGIRLIEVKRPHMKGSRFTPAQIEVFPKLIANGCPVWILTGDSDYQYHLLFKKGNYYDARHKRGDFL